MSTLTNIQILRSAVPYKRPDPGFLLDGQLGINYKDEEPGLFTKLQSGDLVKFGPVQITADGEAPNANPAPDGYPGNSIGEEWLDSRAAFHRPIEHIWDGTDWLVTNGFEVDYNTGDFTLLKKLTITSLETDYVHIDGDLEVNGDITPDGTTCIHDLGTSSERWKGLYACAGDITGDLSLGGSLSLGQDLNIGGTLSVDTDIVVNGNATFGLTCGDGKKFTVKSPTYLDCLVEILGHTQATDLTLSGDLVVEGDITLGLGCSTTLTIKSKTIFECDVEFATNPVTFEYLLVTDLLDSQGDTILGKNCGDKITVNGTATFANCVTTFEGETRIGWTSGSALRTFGPNVFNQDIQGNADLKIPTGKGYSLLTVETDPSDTLTTKGFVEQQLLSITHPWYESGQALIPSSGTMTLLPNGSGSVGDPSDRWDGFYGASLSLTAKGTSAPTLDSDPDDTLITKKWTEDFVTTYVDTEIAANAVTTYWNDLGSSLITKGVKNIIPNGSSSLGLSTNRWNNVYSDSVTATDVYTGDLHMKNERGDWTLIEEEDCLTMTNNKTGKRYAISMTPYTG